MDINIQSIAIEHDVYTIAGRPLIEIQSWNSEIFQGNGGTKELMLFPSPGTAHVSLLLVLAKLLKFCLLSFVSLFLSYYLSGFWSLALLKLLMSMTCMLLPNSHFHPYFTSEQHWIELTIASSFIDFPHSVFRIQHAPVPLVILFHLI